MSALLDAALAYAARGIPVYPAHWPRPRSGGASLGCSCRRGPSCDRPAKHPLVRHGVNDATTNQAQLERWWQRWPDANIGLATGVVFDALDVDGPAGVAALCQLACTADLRLHGPLVHTGGGGWHHWFVPTGLGNRPPRGLPHVDWRGKGGCVLAPPCRHISGGSYRWLRGLDQTPLPEVPTALRTLLEPQTPPSDRADTPTRRVPAGHPYGRRVLADELARLQQAPPRTRNRTLNACAFKVYRYVGGGILDADQVTAAFTDTALAIGLDAAEVRRTLASARAAGLANPRGVPLDPHEGRTPMSARALAIVRAALIWTASALVLAVAVLAFVVSFEAISDFAVQVGAFPPSLRYCAPLLVDSFTAAATLVILWISLTGEPIATAWDAWYAWALIAAATCVSVAINVAHAPDTDAARLVAAVPPIALLLAVELLMILARRCLAHSGAPQAQPTALHPHTAALADGMGAEGVRAAVAELVAQEQAGTRPRLTGNQVAALVGVKERRAQVLLREFRTGKEPSHRNGIPPTRGGN